MTDEDDDSGYTYSALDQYEQLKGELSDLLWAALNEVLEHIFDDPEVARMHSQPLQGRGGKAVWKLDAVAGDERRTIMWTFISDPLIVWLGVWPPA